MIVKSTRGQTLNMGQMIQNHAHKVAVGNAGLNARGDRVTPNGEILETREMMDYNTSQLRRTKKQVGLNDIRREAVSPAEAVANETKAASTAPPAPRHRKIVDSAE